jgi:hypothetical protein
MEIKWDGLPARATIKKSDFRENQENPAPAAF